MSRVATCAVVNGSVPGPKVTIPDAETEELSVEVPSNPASNVINRDEVFGPLMGSVEKWMGAASSVDVANAYTSTAGIPRNAW
tara:strand:+ start:212 stop:460 length:249 start_codon:yes stop_codon:yes gene_type:complete